MNIEALRRFCLNLPAVTEDIKWGNDLCFLIGEKMFCITGLEGPFKFSMKVREDEYDELIARPGIVPAPYLARYKWVLVEHSNSLSQEQTECYITQSYELVKAKLPRSMLKKMRGSGKH